MLQEPGPSAKTEGRPHVRAEEELWQPGRAASHHIRALTETRDKPILPDDIDLSVTAQVG